MEFGRVDRRLHTEFGDPCGQRRYEVSESFRAVLAMELRRTVWGQDSFLLRERSQRETGCVFGCLIGQPDRQLELAGKIDVDVEKFGSQHQRVEMTVEMGGVEPPRHSSFDLGATFSSDFVAVGVFPEVCGGARKAPLAAVQRGA